ncbi:MAG: DUF255 domain-containing protein [Gammaproteobacteria bacterium]|nr:DUF255 domain-containing protein [Gammaproteobacteria bacterium]
MTFLEKSRTNRLSHLIGVLILQVFCLNTVHSATTTLQNQLNNHSSPYLAMHGNDPVQWQEWNAETVARAKKENKLLFVSSGYFSCHWCHVMQRESYKNNEIAALLNKYFIPVKIDRELNPGVDSRLIEFVQKTQGYAGWPLNVFVTPEGDPLFGMTYIPAEQFENVLSSLSKQWLIEFKQLKELALEAGKALSQQEMTSTPIDKKRVAELDRIFVTQASTFKDDLDGGFSEQSKFPSVPQLDYLLQNHAQDWKEFLQLTLDKMSTQGLHDHLYGGFYRYTVDPGWKTPHFEKMLYDNAQLAMLYLNASVVFNNKKYEEVARTTLDFLLEQFQTQEGVFIASLSAIDESGEEGGSYLWQEEALKNILTIEQWQVVKAHWGINGKAELDGGHHLLVVEDVDTLARNLKMSTVKLNKLLMSAREKMKAERKNKLPPKDTKKIAAWNALALQVFTKAAQILDSKKYSGAARKIRNYLFQQLWDGQQLYRTRIEKGPAVAASLEDYAYTSVAIWAWAEFSENKNDKAWVGKLIKQAWNKFYHDGGWQLEEHSLLRFNSGKLVFMDGPMVAPEAMLLDISMRYISTHKDEKALKHQVEQVIQQGFGLIKASTFWYPSRINAMRLYTGHHL